MRTIRSGRSESWMPLIIVAVALALLYFLWNVLIVFVLSALFAFIVHPAVKLLDRRLPRIFSILVVFLVLLILGVLAVGITASAVTPQFRALAEALPEYLEQSRDVFNGIEERYIEVPARWRGVLDRALLELEQVTLRFTGETLPALFMFITGLFALVFVPVLSFFMLLDYKNYKQMLISVTPRRHQKTVSDLLTCLGEVLWNFIKGRLILMVAVGFTTGLGLYLVGMPYPIVFGILAGLLEVIPNLGPIVTTIVVGLVALMISPVLALWAIGVTILVQVLENLLLSPLVMSKAVGLNPVTIVLAIFVGGSTAGILGALIAIPIAVMIKIVILYFYVEDGELSSRTRKACRQPSGGR